jgi:hypothetical protein
VTVVLEGAAGAVDAGSEGGATVTEAATGPPCHGDRNDAVIGEGRWRKPEPREHNQSRAPHELPQKRGRPIPHHASPFVSFFVLRVSSFGESKTSLENLPRLRDGSTTRSTSL